MSSSTPSPSPFSVAFFFFNYPAPSETYTLSLHDALPIYHTDAAPRPVRWLREPRRRRALRALLHPELRQRSEEHTSELQSHSDLVCRLLLEKKKNILNIVSHGDDGGGKATNLARGHVTNV